MTREHCSALLLLAGFQTTRLEELPNGYWPDVPDYAEHRRNSPWWLAKTQHGLLKLGWRKRVISIDWSDTRCREFVTKDEVTKEVDHVHAWGYVKALEYLTELQRSLVGIVELDEGADLMPLEKFINACDGSVFTNDDGIGWLTTVQEPMKGYRTRHFLRPSSAAGKQPKDFAPFTHVAWYNR